MQNARIPKKNRFEESFENNSLKIPKLMGYSFLLFYFLIQFAFYL